MINEYINSIEQSVKDRNFYSALSLSLALPDICGGILFPNQTSSKKRFVDWYDLYVTKKFSNVFCNGKGDLLLSGSDCYALRCSFLHNGSENISTQRAQEVLKKFYFMEPENNWSFNTRTRGDMLLIQVDRFCLLICESVKEWLKINPNLQNLNLLKIYNLKIDGMPL